jgi:hypothetical protein
MSQFAWSKQLVRPFESLFIVTLRFLWLNLPSVVDFCRNFRIKHYELSSIDLTFARIGNRRVDLTKLRDTLFPGDEEWTRSMLGDVHLGSAVSKSARFCKECLDTGFHASIFQLSNVLRCPIHASALIDGCPNCGQSIPTVLTKPLFEHPLACARCLELIIDEKCLLNPPPLDRCEVLETSFRWHEEIFSSPKVLSTDWLQWRSNVPSLNLTIFPLMETIYKKPAPSFLNFARSEYRRLEVRAVSCGISTEQKERVIQQGGWDWPHNEDSDIAVYRWYRRHLRKAIPHSHQKVALFMRLHENPWNAALRRRFARLSDDQKTETFALMLFLFTMERYRPFGKVKENTMQIQNSFDNLFSLKGSWCLYPRLSHQFTCSRAEKRWIRGHFVADGLRGIFEEARHRARAMVHSGHYYLVDLSLIEGFECPLSLALVGSEGKLEYWSMGEKPSLHRYDSDHATFMGPLSRRVFLRDEIWLDPMTFRKGQEELAAGKVAPGNTPEYR